MAGPGKPITCGALSLNSPPARIKKFPTIPVQPLTSPFKIMTDKTYIPPKFLIVGDSGTGKSTSCLSTLKSSYFQNVIVLSTQPSTTHIWTKNSETLKDSRITLHTLYTQSIERETALLLKRLNLFSELSYKSIQERDDNDKSDYRLLHETLNFLQKALKEGKLNNRTVIILDMLTEVFRAVRDVIIGKAILDTLPLFKATQDLALDFLSTVLKLCENSWVIATAHAEPYKTSLTEKTISFIGEKRDNAIISLFTDVFFSYITPGRSQSPEWRWSNYAPGQFTVWRIGTIPAGIYPQDFSPLIQHVLNEQNEST